MARKSYVTRTITTTIVTALVVDTEKQETYTADYAIPRTYKDNKAIMKALEPLATETIIPVRVISSHTEEARFGMLESDFLKYAKPLTKDETDAETADDAANA